jgi:tetratricopeptide (TPR) repeat protein
MSAERNEETLVREGTESAEEKIVAELVDEGKLKTRDANKKSKPVGADPYIRNLLVIAALVIIGALLTMVFAIFTGVISFNDDVARNIDEHTLARAITLADAEETAGATARVAIALIGNGQYLEANALIQEALLADWPDTERNQGVMYAYAILAYEQGDYDAAEERFVYVMDNVLADFMRVYEQDIEPNWARGFGIHPNYFESAVALSFIYRDRGDYEKEIEMLDIAIGGMPTAADLFLFRGQAKLRLGENEAAIDDFNEVLRFISDDADALRSLEEAGGIVND